MRTLFLIFGLIIFNSAFSQELKPTETKALLNFLVTDMEGFPRKNETVIVKDIVNNIEYSAVTNEDGKCGILVPKGKKYKVKYVDLGEKTDYQDFTVPNKFGLMSYNIQIKFEASTKMEVSGIEFEKNTANLTSDSKLRLDSVAEYLKTRKIKIEIAAHTDNSLSKEESMKLSQKRADAIKNYLVEKGVKADNLTAKGYGAEEPVASNNTEEGKAKNNRIEFRVKKLYFY